MKRIFFVFFSLLLAFIFSACGVLTTGDHRVLQGTGTGYGGPITVTVTVQGNRILEVQAEGADETKGIGTMALAQMPTKITMAGSTSRVDTVAGATVTSEGILYAVNNALDPVTYPVQEQEASSQPSAPEEGAPPEPEANEPVGEIGSGLRIGQAEHAAHGTRGFAVASVLLDGDRVLAAALDEYQFMAREGNQGVPGSDGDLGAAYADGETVLASKKVNSASYSALMEAAGATLSIYDNLTAIENYVAGQTIAELEALVNGNNAETVVEAVAGATLVDTSGYIRAIIEAARVAAAAEGFAYEGDTTTLRLTQAAYGAHGTGGFAVASVAVADGSVVLCYLDEFQAMPATEVQGVPNSDSDFGQGFIEGQALASKRVNSNYYSALMESAGATRTIAENYDLIQNYAMGKTITELEEITETDNDESVDAVAGATLVDTKGYISAIVEATQRLAEAS